MVISIEEVVSKINDWRGKQVEMQAIAGGLTNANYKVDVEGVPYFVRVPGESTELLAVNRQNEYYNTKAAAESGVGPKVIHYLPDCQVMVLEFIHGETMSGKTLNAAGMPTRIAESIRKLHAGPRFLTDFNMFRLTEYYLDICEERNIHIPDGYPQRMPTVRSIEQALSAHPLPTVPCNNDLLAENYIDDGVILRLIDYEYSGNNDPCFELGNTCQELKYDEARIQELCSAYFGRCSANKIAGMKLNMILSDVGWALWAAIQTKISKIDYDFWGWATERWGRALEKMDSNDFPLWLEAVRSPD